MSNEKQKAKKARDLETRGVESNRTEAANVTAGDHDGRPYHFDAVYPIQEAVELAQRVRSDPSDIAHVKHACGIVGCVVEKHDDEPEVIGQSKSEDVSDLEIEELCDRIELEARSAREGAGGEEAVPPIVWTLVLSLAQRLIERWLSR